MALDATDETVIYFFFPLIQSQGSNVFADDGVTAEGYLNGDAALNTVTWIKEMVDKGYASATPEANSFELGKAAMAVNGSWAPAVILLFVFLFVPFIMTLGYSFTNYNILKPDAMKFVGLKNFIKLAQDTVFRKSIINTFVFVLLVVPLQVGLGLGLALLINKKLKGISIFRLAFFAPTVLSLVVVSILWSYIYNPNNGLLNSLLGSVGIGPFKFLNDPNTAMLCIVILSAWQGCGFQMMIFLSGLQDIPAYLYEAAAVDGATPFQQFTNITLPGLKNITTFVGLAIVVSAFQLIVQPMMMTGGGPQNSTMTIVYEIYQTGFKYNQMGYGSAMALVFTVMVISDTSKQTVQMALSSLFNIKPVNYGNVMAGLTIVTIPVLILLLALQKYYVAGVASTGAKN